MNKSIETMWKEGFVNEDQLTVPKVNDLYNRKSQNIVDKLQNMFAININAIIIGSLIMLVMMSVIGAPFLGLYICCLLMPLVILAKKELKKSVNLSKGQSSYDYLISFNEWLQSSIDTYSWYYKMFYPLFFLGMATQAIVSKAGGKIIALFIEKFPTDILIVGYPYYLIVLITVLTLIVARYAEALYRLDLNIVYGRQFKKLEELITDMKTLRS
ncbi:MAG: hypothetical protein KC484_01975 [Colwelliaceae bacterium]|nr:hypothetical protein [Colwelliaceae bacterium]